MLAASVNPCIVIVLDIALQAHTLTLVSIRQQFTSVFLWSSASCECQPLYSYCAWHNSSSTHWLWYWFVNNLQVCFSEAVICFSEAVIAVSVSHCMVIELDITLQAHTLTLVSICHQFTSVFLWRSDCCECQSLHSYCPKHTLPTWPCFLSLVT